MSYGQENLSVFSIYMFGLSSTVSCLFIGYSERYKGFRFYCPSTKNIKTDNTKFIEKIQNNGSQLHKDFIFEEEQIVMCNAPSPQVRGRYRVVSELRFTPGVGNHLG